MFPIHVYNKRVPLPKYKANANFLSPYYGCQREDQALKMQTWKHYLLLQKFLAMSGRYNSKSVFECVVLFIDIINIGGPSFINTPGN